MIWNRRPKSPFTLEVQARLGPLLRANGMRLVEESFHPQTFGNGVATYQARHLAIRVVRDRGQVFLEARRRGEKTWRDAGLVWNGRALAVGDLEAAAIFLETHLSELGGNRG